MPDAMQKVIMAARARQAREGRRGLKKRPPVWLRPDGVQRDYMRALLEYVSDVRERTRNVLVSALPRILAEAGQRNDGTRLDDWPSEIERLIESLTVYGERRAQQVDPRIYAGRISDFNAAQRNQIIRSVLGVDVIASEPWMADMLASWAAENRRLIRSITSDSLTQIDGMVQRGVRGGEGIDQLTSKIMDRFGVAESRARLIARDQTGKLNSQLTEERQESLGVTQYTWRNVDDERVRGNPGGLYPESEFNHWSREGRVYSWDSPPADGHPGIPIQCRCYAEPVLDHLIEAADEQNPAMVAG